MGEIEMHTTIEERDLGVMIDHELKFDIHLESQVNNANSKRCLIRILFDALDDDAFWGLQTTQPTSGGAVTVVTDWCANSVETFRPQQWGGRFTIFGQAGHADPRLLIKVGDVETNPSPIATHKQVRICNICHKQIHGMKQIFIRCNRIEHWVHLRCTGILLAQYTDIWTCYLHRESRLTTHTDITPSHPPRP